MDVEDYSLTVGVQLLGHFLNTFLFGLVCYQYSIYWSTCFGDPLWIRLLVMVLVALDAVNSGIAVYQAWDMCIINFMDPSHLAYISWTLSFTVCCNSVVCVLCQGFLIHRIYVLTRSKILAGAISALSAVTLFFGCYTGAKAIIIHEVKNYPRIYNYATVWLTFQMAADIIITVSLIRVLGRARTGVKSTDWILNKLIRGAVQTGLFATIFALGDLLSFVLASQTSLHGFFVYSMGRIYTNTLLDSLICRKGYRENAPPSELVEHGSNGGDTYGLEICGPYPTNDGASLHARPSVVVFAKPRVDDPDVESLSNTNGDTRKT